MKKNRHETFSQGFSFLLKGFVSALCLLLATTAGAQVPAGTVSGIVTDTAGQPVVGATVTVLGSDGAALTGVATDIEGQFSVKASEGQRLEVSFLGMQTKIIPVRGGGECALEHRPRRGEPNA